MNKSEQAVLPKRSLKRFRSCWIIPLFLGAIVWSLCRPTPALAQNAPTTPLIQNMKRLWHWGGVITSMTPVSNTLYVGMGGGLVLLDITEPATPKLVSQLSLNVPVYEIEIVGDYALLATWGKGLLIVDVSDKRAPRLVAEHLISYIINSIAIATPYAYIAYDDKIAILDVTYPETPSVVNLEMAGIDNFDLEDVQIANGYLFAVGGKSEQDRYPYRTWGVLQAFHLADPRAPTPLPAYRTEVGIADNKQFGSIRLQQDRAYVVQADSILQFTITNPATLKLSSQLNLTGLAPSSLTVLGTRLYIAQRTGLENNAIGIRILDISSTLTTTASLFLPQLVRTLVVQGNYAFVGRDDDGLHVLDVTQSLPPHEIGSYRTIILTGGA